MIIINRNVNLQFNGRPLLLGAKNINLMNVESLIMQYAPCWVGDWKDMLKTFYIIALPTIRFGQNVPAYSGKHIVSGDFLIFSSNKSFLFKKRIIDVSVNHLLLQIESNSFKLSCIRF